MAREPEEVKRAIDLVGEIERMSGERSLWPNFDPLSIPYSFFDGNNTYLFRYPGVPEGFLEINKQGARLLLYCGRHPAVVAHSTAMVAGRLVATLLIDCAPAAQTPRDLASIAIHEAFHVFQQLHHPTWTPDTGTLFLYPVTDSKLLCLRRMETEAFRRALVSQNPREQRSWTLQALQVRKYRFDRLETEFSTYEQQEELLEGLATYVEARAVGRTTVDLPQRGFRADDVRGRTYKIGQTLAVLLDTIAPDWKADFEKDDSPSLDLYLTDALHDSRGSDPGVEFAQSEIANLEIAAKRDTRALLKQRAQKKETFDSRSSRRLTVIASVNRPLRVTGIDPSNATIVDGGVLHTRYVKLAHDSGRFEMMSSPGDGVEALTEAAGSHPILSGVRTLQVVGHDKLKTKVKDGSVEVAGKGLSARFDKAILDKHGSKITIRL